MKVHERVETRNCPDLPDHEATVEYDGSGQCHRWCIFGRNKCRHYDEAKRHALEVLEFTNLIQKKDFSAKELGTSDKKRLELTRALVARPDLLLLDEVMAGLNPTETDECADLIRKVNQSGITVFLIEHVMRAWLICVNISSCYTMVKRLQMVCQVSVMNDRMVMEVYLGKDDTYAQVDDINVFYGASRSSGMCHSA